MNEQFIGAVGARGRGTEILILEVLCFLIDHHGLDRLELAQRLETRSASLAVEFRDTPYAADIVYLDHRAADHQRPNSALRGTDGSRAAGRSRPNRGVLRGLRPDLQRRAGVDYLRPGPS